MLAKYTYKNEFEYLSYKLSSSNWIPTWWLLDMWYMHKYYDTVDVLIRHQKHYTI